MKLPQHPARRGQPLAALALVLLAWVGARTALWAASPRPGSHQVAALASLKPGPAPAAATPDKVSPTIRVTAEPEVPPQTSPLAPDLPATHAPGRPELTAPTDPVASPTTQAPETLPPRIAAGHQLLFLAGMSALPMPEEALAAAPAPARSGPPPVPYLQGVAPLAQRWSADGWLLLRPGGNGFNLPGAGLPGANLPSGAYGASQAGVVLRYHLAPASPLRLTLYLRASSGLHYPRGEEVAAGLSLRPLGKVPVAVMVEGRVTRTISGDVVRPAAALVSEVPPVALPLGLRGEVYGQAGWVGGKDHTPFIDGQARIDKPAVRAGKIELRLGAGAWGGAQREASRLDMGPSATLDLPLGPVNTRVSADYRFRVLGNAAPGNGPAVTLSAGF